MRSTRVYLADAGSADGTPGIARRLPSGQEIFVVRQCSCLCRIFSTARRTKVRSASSISASMSHLVGVEVYQEYEWSFR